MESVSATKSWTGNPVNRIDGILKVTGKAKYATEFPVKDVVYARGVNSTIAKGEITSIDTSEAEKQEGVLQVITYKNAAKLQTWDKQLPEIDTKSIAPVLQSPEVNFYGEFIALVVAETPEQADYAARLIKVDYNKADPKINISGLKDEAYKPNEKSDSYRGDIEQGMRDAFVTIDETYNTPVEHHHPMELHALIAQWEGDKVTTYICAQIVDDAATTIADTFRMPKENVHIISPYIGGGFGSKLQAREHVILAVMAARMVGRPVQLTVTRQQMFTNTGLRQHDEQRMRIGATKDGKLTALGHETLSHTAATEEYQEQCGAVSTMLYNVKNNLVKHRLISMNLPSPRWMRAPGEATGSFALESAMDEMAWKLKMDPVQFRIINDTQTDLSNNKPFSSRLLVECLRIGAEKFGWDKWKMQPRSNRNGNWLIGYGMSAASRRAPYQKTSASVKLSTGNGKAYATIQMDGTDIGTGSYTIVAQTAAEYLGLPLEQVTVELGDSRFPVTPGSGGSWGAANYCNAARVACINAKKELQEKAGNTADDIFALMQAAEVSTYEAKGTAAPTETFKKHSVYSFGANFAEVWVDSDTGMVRIKRMLNVCAAGKVLNPKTAYGQVIGGLTMGTGMALTEQSIVEPQYGNFITRTLADYHVPVNLDMARIEVIFLPEEDPIANPMGVKGIGELGITSVAATIANAVFNATGKRIRDLPITPEKLIDARMEPGVV